MGHLFNRNIIIGVTGGIAAYKSAELVRLLRKSGASVRVIMTRGAQEFITPLTLQALSGMPVHTELLDEEAELGMGHIELARWADALLIAPATADVIARLCHGRADDLLTTTALATPAPRFIAPAMNQQMWADAATADNIQLLQHRGFTIVGPEAGDQACGDIGPGRLLDPEAIVETLSGSFAQQKLAGRRVVITAGPTREPIDPVRFLSNHSSGKMGYALARAAMEQGAETVLISGPVQLTPPDGVVLIKVETAQEMLAAAEQQAAGADVFIGAAAVADYRPVACADQKLKKTDTTDWQLPLTQNPDIIASVARLGQRPKMVIGFAAETERVAEHARSKLTRKALDLVIANDVSRPDIGFNSDHNAVLLVDVEGDTALPMASKHVVAQHIVAAAAEWLAKGDRVPDRVSS
ncbi:phosphopantothenoylcysteine decarboxylase/phosphopantothenate--cysteine ligase [Luminiphilus syltensis NOR5-1B]|uniref:Coenzyme A biosynthesis bifunctional protein CoaBC n=1 Tax=Luminiphilus syltensis NOR5-1B TaxID=565045 RepID=B8KU96_9GAMM|nr:bifunctional phosphopantothenoylcysteine decarboxylase/phosphopantothenate--cysteine ligase CoaBC [Luminiphilus syltensis]EED35877.1 phosphopantothenoylcysteine decarboxylase/phosphopantothenate--cysteine ligase [Luminiphilus syltensis NOR5-1B]